MSRYRCMCPRHRPSALAEIAPRLARARDLLEAERTVALAAQLADLRLHEIVIAEAKLAEAFGVYVAAKRGLWALERTA